MEDRTRHFGRADRLAIAMIVLYLATLFLWLTWLSPRPYTVVENDLENDYFYNSLTHNDGYACLGSKHPGMPARFSYLLLFRLFGTETGPQFQAALNWSYAGVFVLTAFAAVWFHVRVRSLVSPWIAFLASITAITSPPALGFYNHFGSDSFVLPFGLVLAGLGWTILRRQEAPSQSAMAGLGAISGLCLSTKLTFAPLIAPLGAAVTLASFLQAGPRQERAHQRSRVKRGAARAASFWLSLAAVHVLTCIPIGTGLYWVWRLTLKRPDAFPASGSILDQVARSTLQLLEVDPGYVLLMVGAFSVLAWQLVTQRLRPRNKEGQSTWPRTPELVFVVGSLAALAYTLAASSIAVGTFRDAGFSLRNTGPSLLALPVLVLCTWGGASTFRRPGSQRWALIVAIAMAAFATSAHVARRERFLLDYARYSAAAIKRFDELRRPDTRVAVWEKNGGATLGEITFRYWGNYRWYRQDSYDDITLSRFPGFTFFPLRDFGRPERVPDQPASLPARRGGELRRLVGRLADPFQRRLRAWFPYRDTSGYGRTEGRRELFTGEGRGVEVSLIAYPVSHERKELKITRPELLARIAARLGPAECREEDLGGIRWVLIRIGTGPPSAAH